MSRSKRSIISLSLTSLFHWEHISFSARSIGLPAPHGGSHFKKLIGFAILLEAAGRMSYTFLGSIIRGLKRLQKGECGTKGKCLTISACLFESLEGVLSEGTSFR